MTQQPRARVRAVAAVAGLVAGAPIAWAGPPAQAAGAAPPVPCVGTSPVTCHYALAPGNYDVAVSIGGAASAGDTSIWVEARRLMMPAAGAAGGPVTRYSATVNVRQPEGQPTGQGGTGTPGLDITFAGPAPKVTAVAVTPASPRLAVYLAGDSTVCDQPTQPYTGWGQMITARVGPGAVVANYADSGESSGSFLADAALFPALRPLIRQRDLVLIQFGHNDKTTTAAAYRDNLATMISQVRARGGVPVLVTPPVRRLFNGDQLTPTALHVNGLGVDLPAEMRALGAARNVPVIDLTARSEALVESLGPAASSRLYLTAATDGVTDNTHFSGYGATQMADLVVRGVRERGLSLVRFLR